MKMLMLGLRKVKNVEGDWWESNVIMLNGGWGVEIEMGGSGNWGSRMECMSGMKLV